MLLLKTFLQGKKSKCITFDLNMKMVVKVFAISVYGIVQGLSSFFKSHLALPLLHCTFCWGPDV